MNKDTIKVLLLEDDPQDFHLLARHLPSGSGRFSLSWVQTVRDALKKLQSEQFDIVLSDLTVPDSQGMATITQLKNRCGSAPIIVMTGLDDEVLEHELLEAGAQDYLVKGELGGRAVTRAIRHAVQRQSSMNEVNALVEELAQSHQLLEEQARLLKRKNRRLRRLYRTAQEFVDNVSHDFRTPLTVIKDYVSIIREGMVGDINDQQQEMLDKVVVRADDLNMMVDDLLDVSKLEAGLLGAWRRSVSVCDLIHRAESMLQQRASAKNVEFVVECEENLPLVYCDSDKIGRVISNLTVNAIKFSGNPGTVRLWAEADPAGHQVVIGVTDNGPGIDKKSLAQIFKRFKRLGTCMDSSVKGFGLGLNIARRLTRLNLGVLSVRSQVGAGSTFSFTIPIADPREVFRRWLKFRRKNEDYLRVVEIAIPEETTTQLSDDFDCFLNCLLRRDDLLYRVAANKWLCAMGYFSAEAKIWFNRTQEEYEKANRNRPLGPLPTYQAHVRRAWELCATTEEIVQDFDTLASNALKSADTTVTIMEG